MAQSARSFLVLPAAVVVMLAGGVSESQAREAGYRLSLQAGTVVFDELYGYSNSNRFTLSGTMRVASNLHLLVRTGFIPARQKFFTPAGAMQADVRLYEFSLGGRSQRPQMFGLPLRPFAAIVGGVLWHRPQAVNVPVGQGGVVRVEPPAAAKPLLSAAVGIDWRVSRIIALSFAIEASASRIAERQSDGSSRDGWQPFYSAAMGMVVSIR